MLCLGAAIRRRTIGSNSLNGRARNCGSKAGFLQATVAFGLARPDLREEFGAYLNDMVALQKAAQ